MGFRDRIQAKMSKHGGVVGLAKAAVRKAGGGGSETSDTTSASKTQALGPLPKAPASDGFIAVGHSAKLSTTTALQVVRGKDAIAIFRTEKGLRAIDNICTHEDGPLGEGEVKDCVVACPYHDWRFDLSTGECLSHPGREVATFAVRESDGIVWLGAQTSAGSGERGGAHDDGMEVLVKDLDEES